MGSKSDIEWTDASWTPIRARNRKTGKVGWHCEHATTGCEFCYAEGLNKRLGTGLPFKPGHRDDIEIFLDETMLLAPLKWKRPRMIFVCSMTDLFADFVPDEWIDRVFAVMALCPQHIFQVLTKRAERMREYLTSRVADNAESVRVQLTAFHAPHGKWCKQISWPLPNVWLGVSTERQKEYDERWPQLASTPAAVRFISYEPALGPINLQSMAMVLDHPIKMFPDWVICGGESGPGARPMHPDWARNLRDECALIGVPFFFKQWGAYQPNFPQYADEFGMEETDMLCDGKDFPDEGVLYASGHFYDGIEYQPHTGERAYWMTRVGKKASGRLLDGITHDAMPAIPPHDGDDAAIIHEKQR